MLICSLFETVHIRSCLLNPTLEAWSGSQHQKMIRFQPGSLLRGRRRLIPKTINRYLCDRYMLVGILLTDILMDGISFIQYHQCMSYWSAFLWASTLNLPVSMWPCPVFAYLSYRDVKTWRGMAIGQSTAAMHLCVRLLLRHMMAQWQIY